MHENEEILGRGGRASLASPLRSATDNVCFFNSTRSGKERRFDLELPAVIGCGSRSSGSRVRAWALRKEDLLRGRADQHGINEEVFI